MKYNKITTGFVIQTYEVDGEKENPILQNFIAGDPVERETEDGEPTDWVEKNYLPFDMLQPDSIQISRKELSDLRESIQDDIISCLDGTSNRIVNNVCQIVVDKVNLFLEKTPETENKM